MQVYCLKDTKTGLVFKVFFTVEKLNSYLEENPHMSECVNCIECEDAPSILLE